ncbi:MAG: hypothetical protein HFG89_07650 [Dorea sp.]|nr:hypothetical protein [Dorea sp.]
MKRTLREYFPILQSRKEILKKIHGKKDLEEVFDRWEVKQQEEFLDFCTGARGVKMLYDFCAKAILNPEVYPERIEELISLLLGKKVRLLKVLPNDNTRIADETSLLIMDFLVELTDGSIANVEIQKVGYAFPGQRSACYSADLLLRQYRRVRNQMTKETFSYREISNVYTIVLFEKSTPEFHTFPDQYIHKFRQRSDTGLKIDLLQEFVFVALDIYREKYQNKNIEKRLDGWLTFLNSDEPEDIIALIEKYPDFKAMYEQVYEICRNIEQVMGMFSKELYELDRNTVRYMIDELQEEYQKQKEKNQRQKEENQKQKEENQKQKEENQRQKEEIEYLKEQNKKNREENERLMKEIEHIKHILG